MPTKISYLRNSGFAPPALPGFLATTGRSAPAPRIGTQPLAVSAAWGSPWPGLATSGPPAYRDAGSHVSYERLDRARATSMPVSRHGAPAVQSSVDGT